MFVTADQLVCHAIGDYVLQSDWMASAKTKKSLAAAVHVLTYALPFLFLTLDWRALAFIVATHFVIDRWRLARYACWVKNWVGPRGSNISWKECSATGYTPDKPPWLAVWLMIVTDNIGHVLCNALALKLWA